MQHRKWYLTGGQVIWEPLDFAESSFPCAPGQLLLQKHTHQTCPADHQEITTSQQGSGSFLPLPALSLFPGLKMSDFGLWAQLNFSLCLKQAHTQKINVPQISFLISFLNTKLLTIQNYTLLIKLYTIILTLLLKFKNLLQNLKSKTSILQKKNQYLTAQKTSKLPHF